VNDEIQVAKYYKLSADQGYSCGPDNCEWCLLSDVGLQKDAALAVHYCKLAADHRQNGTQFNYSAVGVLKRGARWKRPAIGDPILQNGGGPGCSNYRFLAKNPVKRIRFLALIYLF